MIWQPRSSQLNEQREKRKSQSGFAPHNVGIGGDGRGIVWSDVHRWRYK